jgi:hypothetical protein
MLSHGVGAEAAQVVTTGPKTSKNASSIARIGWTLVTAA